MTRFDLLNLIGMFENDSKLILHLVEYAEFAKAQHRLREMIRSMERLRECNEMAQSNGTFRDSQ